MSQWFVYILLCADDSLYTGVTTDLERRVREHNEAKVGAKYTRNRRPVTLVYSEKADNRSEACKRESAIKRLSRQGKIKLVNQRTSCTK